jgi:hypothetical protein
MKKWIYMAQINAYPAVWVLGSLASGTAAITDGKDEITLTGVIRAMELNTREGPQIAFSPYPLTKTSWNYRLNLRTPIGVICMTEETDKELFDAYENAVSLARAKESGIELP